VKIRYIQHLVRRSLYPIGTRVLLYHQTTKKIHDPQLLAVSPANFRKHLKFLKRNYRIISPDEFEASINSGKAINNSVLVTFDDGYADNLSETVPILEDENTPAIFFVATRTAYALTANQISKLSRSKVVTIGGHTHTHPNLASLPNDSQVEEIAINKRILEKACGYKIKFFAYPFGGIDNFTVLSREIVSKYYRLAFTALPGIANNHFNRWELPRINIRNWTVEKLESVLS